MRLARRASSRLYAGRSTARPHLVAAPRLSPSSYRVAASTGDSLILAPTQRNNPSAAIITRQYSRPPAKHLAGKRCQDKSPQFVPVAASRFVPAQCPQLLIHTRRSALRRRQHKITGACRFTAREATPLVNAEELSGTGTGLVVSRDGYLITCAHVVEDASRITVTIGDKSWPG